MKNKKYFMIGVAIGIFVLSSFTLLFTNNLKDKKVKTKKITATVMAMGDGSITVQDDNQVIYTFLEISIWWICIL